MLMTNAQDIRRFVTAGNATVTLSSVKTGARFTYKVSKVKDAETKFFVSLMNGPDNETSFAYLGLLDGASFRTTKKSCAAPDAPSARAMRFFCEQVLAAERVPEQLEVRHEGRCGKCNHKLTTPESVDRGIGPECWGRMR